MAKTKIFLAAWIILCVLCLSSLVLASGLKTGEPAPFFKVISGFGETLTLDNLKGKAAGIFYETTDVVKENSALKEALGKYYEAQPESVRKLMVRLPVINCSKVLWPLAGVYKSQFRKHSKIENITIFADWSGKMFSDYNIEPDKSNVFLVDKQGVIRYYAAGKIDGPEVERVVNLFKQLVEE